MPLSLWLGKRAISLKYCNTERDWKLNSALMKQPLHLFSKPKPQHSPMYLGGMGLKKLRLVTNKEISDRGITDKGRKDGGYKVHLSYARGEG